MSEEANGLTTRVRLLEDRYSRIDRDIRDLKNEDIAEIKHEVQALRKDLNLRGQGMSRAEKIALGGLATTLLMAVIAAVALIQQAPT